MCQSHTGHMTGLWFLPARPLRLNINEWYVIRISKITAQIWAKSSCLLPGFSECKRGKFIYFWYSSPHKVSMCTKSGLSVVWGFILRPGCVPERLGVYKKAWDKNDITGRYLNKWKLTNQREFNREKGGTLRSNVNFVGEAGRGGARRNKTNGCETRPCCCYIFENLQQARIYLHSATPIFVYSC